MRSWSWSARGLGCQVRCLLEGFGLEYHATEAGDGQEAHLWVAHVELVQANDPKVLAVCDPEKAPVTHGEQLRIGTKSTHAGGVEPRPPEQGAELSVL
jgi:hypothetical protein